MSTKTFAYSVEISPTSRAVTTVTREGYAEIVKNQGFDLNFQGAIDLEDGVEFARLDDGRKIYRETK